MESFNGGIGVLILLFVPSLWIIARDIYDTRQDYLERSSEGKKILEERWGHSGERHYLMQLIIFACLFFFTIFLVFKFFGY